MKGQKRNLIFIVMSIWGGVIGASYIWQEMDTRREEKVLALNTASAFFQQIVVSRLWNASHGGVYVPITAMTPPNEYLPTKNRDLTADNGLKLTKVNPSYMTRQIAELAEKNMTGIQFHITSLKPIRPENKAKEWEERWLKSFEQGVKEQGGFIKDGETTWFRYMAPLLTDAGCLMCHAQQGYKEGDIRGGLSVSLPYPTHTHIGILAGHGLAAVLGLIFIFIGGTLYERKRLLFDATFDSAIPTNITDKNHDILMANQSYLDVFGPIHDNKKTIKCYEHRPGKSCHTAQCPLAKVMGGMRKYAGETIKENEGVPRFFIVTAKPLLDSRGKTIGIVESFQDITELKMAEKKLEEFNRKLEALSVTDGLTGIANRRHFDEVLAREHARHARSGAELSLVLLDIDYFKLFNDSYGHVKGDECLRQVAQIVAGCAGRDADLTARYGGEEFACILPDTDRTGAIAIAEKIRCGILARAIPHKESKVADCVTASLGAVTVRCTPDGAVEDLVTQADKLLYRAKASGRNRVEFAAVTDAAGEIKGNLVQLIWKDHFCCGDQLIDSQHQSIFRIANEVLEAVLSARPGPEISLIIRQLLDDVSQHFHDEEKILEAIGFPGMDRHVAEHAKLLAKGIELSQEFKTGTLGVGGVFQFLANEVVMLHMLGADHEYFPFIKETGVADPGVLECA